jgi:hypothetical protein
VVPSRGERKPNVHVSRSSRSRRSLPISLYGETGPSPEDERWLIESQYHDEQTTGGRLLNILAPTVESAGCELRSVSEDGLAVVVAGQLVRITWENLDARSECPTGPDRLSVAGLEAFARASAQFDRRAM